MRHHLLTFLVLLLNSGLVFAQKRTGEFYYINSTNQQASIKLFYDSEGYYCAVPSTLNQMAGGGAFIRYEYESEDGQYYVFQRVKTTMASQYDMANMQVRWVTKRQPLPSFPKMLIAKNWKRVIIQRASSGNDMILDKEVTKTYYEQLLQAKTNIYNNAGGIYGGNKGNDTRGSGSSSKGRQCRGCNGSGQCSMCKGKGWYKNSYDGDVYTCPTCNQTGQCKVCYGKGYISD